MPQTYTFPYPVSPPNINKEIIEPSPAFKKEVAKVFWSIIGFFFTYFLLVVGAIAFAFLCGYGGIMLMKFMPGLFTILTGLGMIGFGMMVLFFLVKFVFSSYSTDRSGLIQISAKEQPVLFDFINQLASEVGITPPKRIYISSDVNASVFYDSGFRSMFLPVRKNLQIGLGLVNTSNISEFKAVIAHEFGHFSQRSMKLGSYVYNVNKMIYNMLYDNRDYNRSLESLSGVSNHFSFFATLTQAVVEVMQSILKSQYATINERHLALSRQMEFHADSVAASVSGSQALISLLRRLELSEYSYHRVLSCYTNWRKNNVKALNIYPDHTEVMRHIAIQNGLEQEGELPKVTSGSFTITPKTRIVIQDLWATHPGIDDRENHLKELNITADHLTVSSWALFVNAQQLQQQVTDQLYEEIDFQTPAQVMDNEQFQISYYSNEARYSFDKKYKGFYDDREINEFDVELLAKEAITVHSLNEILTEPTLQLSMRIRQMETEINVLESIRQKSSRIDGFEFKGEQFSKRDAAALIKVIHKELTDTRRLRDRADQQLFQLYHHKSGSEGKGSAAVNDYQKMFAVNKFTKDEEKKVEDIIREVSQLYQDEVTTGMAYAVNNNMLRKEVPVKKSMQNILHDEDFVSYYSAEEKEKLSQFVAQQRASYAYPKIDSLAVNQFMDCMRIYSNIIYDSAFDIRKQTLARQIEVIANSAFH